MRIVIMLTCGILFYAGGGLLFAQEDQPLAALLPMPSINPMGQVPPGSNTQQSQYSPYNEDSYPRYRSHPKYYQDYWPPYQGEYYYDYDNGSYYTIQRVPRTSNYQGNTRSSNPSHSSSTSQQQHWGGNMHGGTYQSGSQPRN